MLKIKDNVDLKKLEKFGFMYCKSIECYEKTPKQNFYDELVSYYITKNKEIQVNTYNGDYPLDDTLYDLIQAGLVEKV